MANYADAALRHWEDAKLLEQESRIENADHHVGIAAECAIKTVLVTLPVFAPQGTLEGAYLHHVDVLWGRVNRQGLQKLYPLLSALLKMPNPFVDWEVSQRYSANGTVSIEMLNAHKAAAKRILGSCNLTGVRAK